MTPARTIPIRTKAPQWPAPAHLGPAGVEHWNRVTSAVTLEAMDLATLEAACVQYDRAAAFRADITERGEMVPDRFGILKPNMAVQFERQALDAAKAHNRELGLYTAEAVESRPPAARGYH